MIVYLDVLLFENLIVNLFLLHLTARTIRIRVKFRYMLLAAILGSIYVLTLIYPTLAVFSITPFKIIAALIIVFITFRKMNILFNVKVLCIFILYSMVLAGICIFIQFNQGSDIGYSVIINFSYKKLMISLMIIYMLIERIIVYIKERKIIKNLIYSVEIILDDSNKNVKAFLDTGNELREPATNLPVIIVEKSVFYDVDLNSYDKFYIPYKVVDGQGGNLQGFKPQCVKIKEGKETVDKEVIIAFCENKLSEINEYQALLSRGVIM
ncbi:sigma-E processing peptidase SpoIIGA [Clostridiaceae bacterium UIB06]|uniref:Sporulation sigma-E factor-processing peptidase n=1 Tax=Clostridium thailandense TaxID=2794346 RepID=A0A949WPX0_9CLOT|nr:sigma-E processing peptidase SpoIIGA [Clostridium thailandense]MBV7271910.1 sigma-E processing peptidase SpoIIGA [Clostridium thailandense]MCH5137136.1 sigma-E processing peptidase SpoIIGA [Clostridiaceae bacterium UIB06]